MNNVVFRVISILPAAEMQERASKSIFPGIEKPPETLDDLDKAAFYI